VSSQGERLSEGKRKKTRQGDEGGLWGGGYVT